MKVKITLIVTSHDNRYGILNPNRVKLLVCEDLSMPSKYLGSDNEDETLRSICSKHLNYHYDWLIKDLIAFRKMNNSESEVVYLTTIPSMDGCHKMGNFYSAEQIDNLEIDSYYVQLVSKFGSARRR
jgi:hypothetical protein